MHLIAVDTHETLRSAYNHQSVISLICKQFDACRASKTDSHHQFSSYRDCMYNEYYKRLIISLTNSLVALALPFSWGSGYFRSFKWNKYMVTLRKFRENGLWIFKTTWNFGATAEYIPHAGLNTSLMSTSLIWLIPSWTCYKSTIIWIAASLPKLFVTPLILPSHPPTYFWTLP